jgi:hypothetical protein
MHGRRLASRVAALDTHATRACCVVCCAQTLPAEEEVCDPEEQSCKVRRLLLCVARARACSTSQY